MSVFAAKAECGISVLSWIPASAGMTNTGSSSVSLRFFLHDRLFSDIRTFVASQ